MMKMPNALEFIKNMQNDFREMAYSDANEAQAQNYVSEVVCKQIIDALEKQVPKKPNKAIDSSWGIKKEVHVCPVCDCYLTEVHFIGEANKKITFCETCGQAIDWSDE